MVIVSFQKHGLSSSSLTDDSAILAGSHASQGSESYIYYVGHVSHKNIKSASKPYDDYDAQSDTYDKKRSEMVSNVYHDKCSKFDKEKTETVYDTQSDDTYDKKRSEMVSNVDYDICNKLDKEKAEMVVNFFINVL